MRDADRGVAIGVEEHFVVVDHLLEDEGELVAIDAVDHGMDALMEGVHGVERLEKVADEEDGGVAAGIHWETL